MPLRDTGEDEIPVPVDLVFCVDCTSAMAPFLASVKEQLLTLLGGLARAPEGCEEWRPRFDIRARAIGFGTRE